MAEPDRNLGNRACQLAHQRQVQMARDNYTLSERSGQPVVSARTVDAYTVSSQMGFEAILDSHKPRVLDQLFYAGWH